MEGMTATQREVYHNVDNLNLPSYMNIVYDTYLLKQILHHHWVWMDSEHIVTYHFDAIYANYSCNKGGTITTLQIVNFLYAYTLNDVLNIAQLSCKYSQTGLRRYMTWNMWTSM